MHLQTLTVIVPTDPTTLFNYLTDIRNFPEWATEFCRELRDADGRPQVTTPFGDLYLTIRADTATGVIDFCTSADGNSESVLPTRVVELPDGHSAYVVAFSLDAEVPEESFRQQCVALQREMENIRQHFS